MVTKQQLKTAFQNHKQRAKRYGIDFNLTETEWLDIWESSGHVHDKGTHRGGYVMSRFNDTGSYEVGNVKIQTVGENTKEAFLLNNKDFIKSRPGKENNFYGKTHSDESIQKIKAVRAKQVFGPESNTKRSEAMKLARANNPNWGKKLI